MSDFKKVLFVNNNLDYLIHICESLLPDSLIKYVYLEKALLANSNNKRNEGYFTSEDTKQLMNSFNIETSELLEVYSEIYGLNDKTNLSDISSNFYKMLKSKRNPNVILIEALIQIILHNRIKSSDNGSFSSDHIIKPKLQYKKISSDECYKIESYIRFCFIISTLEDSYLKPFEINEGKNLLKNKAQENIEILIPILFNTSLLFEYISPAYEDDVCCDNTYELDLEVYYEDICRSIDSDCSLVELPDYISVCNEWKDSNLNMSKCFAGATSGLLIFLRNYMRELQELDYNFWQLLFLLIFFKSEDLKELRRYRPSHSFNIKREHCNDYYDCVKQIIELPDIEEFTHLSSDVRNDAVKTIVQSKEEDKKLPDWAYFVMYNIWPEHLKTAKYLYLTFVLGYRYRNTNQYNKLPKELLDLFIKQNKDIKKNIEKIDDL